MAEDMVNHPSHYTMGGIETIDFIEAKRLGPERAHVVRYLTRAPFKGKPIQDLEKAQFYLNRLLARLSTCLDEVIDPDLVAAVEGSLPKERPSMTVDGEERPILRCTKCLTEFLGKPDGDYSAGVLCQECRARGYTMLGVCHPTGEKLHQKDVDLEVKDGG